MLHLQRHQEDRRVPEISTKRTSTTIRIASSRVVMNVTVARMDPPPGAASIDQNLLIELTRLFPMIPQHVIRSLIQAKKNDREQCMIALNLENQRNTVNKTVHSPASEYPQPSDSLMNQQVNAAVGITPTSCHEKSFKESSILYHAVSTGTQQFLISTVADHAKATTSSSFSSSLHPAHHRPTGQLVTAFPPTSYDAEKQPLVSPVSSATQGQTSQFHMYSTSALENSSPPPTTQSVTFVSQVNKYIGPQGGSGDAVTASTKTSINIPVTPPIRKNMGHGEQPMESCGVCYSVVREMTNAPSGSQNTSNLLSGVNSQMTHILQLSQDLVISGGTEQQTSEDRAYLHSLVLHQKSRLQKLHEDYNAAFEYCEKLKHDVQILEKQVLEKRKSRIGHHQSISMTDLQKVQEENRTLQVDSHLLILEFDRLTKGEPVIGQDPNENFYARIPGGQKRVLPASNHIKKGSTAGSAANKRITGGTQPSSPPSSHPPAPPSLVNSGHDIEEESWNCSVCTFANHPELTVCEMCNMPRVARR